MATQLLYINLYGKTRRIRSCNNDGFVRPYVCREKGEKKKRCREEWTERDGENGRWREGGKKR